MFDDGGERWKAAFAEKEWRWCQVARRSPGEGARQDLHLSRLRRNREVPPSPEVRLEWPWRATWVCQADASHIEVVTPGEEKAVGSRRR